MSVPKVLDPAISSVDLGTFAVDRVGMKKDVTGKWEIRTIMFACPKLKKKRPKVGFACSTSFITY